MDPTANKINKILDKIRPYIKMHGGDVELKEFGKGGVAILKISGSCVNCALADMTYNKMIGGILKQDIPEVKEVVITSK